MSDASAAHYGDATLNLRAATVPQATPLPRSSSHMPFCGPLIVLIHVFKPLVCLE
jgi:hypothetical protein